MVFKKYRKYFLYFLIFVSIILFSLYSHHTKLILATKWYDHPILISGHVDKIIHRDPKLSRFIFMTNKMCLKRYCKHLNKTLVLSWYYPKSELNPLQAGELMVKLKPWHSISSPGAYDQELSAYINTWSAKGYVIKGDFKPLKIFAPIRHLRAYLIAQIDANLPNNLNERAIIKTLIFANKEDLAFNILNLFQKTGTSHLLAISGMHVGLMASLGFFLFKYTWRQSAKLCLCLPAKKIGAVGSLLFAGAYCLLAGFSLPTARALMMITVFISGILFSIPSQVFRPLLLAAIITLVFKPLSSLEPSFLLSYSAVFFMMYAIAYRLYIKKMNQVVAMQLGITLGLLPFGLYFFQQFSLISPLANLLAIPLLSFIILPLSFISLATVFFSSTLAHFLLQLDADCIHGLLLWLSGCASVPHAQIWAALSSLSVFISCLVGILLILSPRVLQLKLIGIIFLLSAMFYHPLNLQVGQLRLSILDVGQGLSVVINTTGHTMVYDLGASYPSGYSFVQASVLPYLREEHISNVNTIMLSHKDNDHVGEWQSMRLHFPKAKFLTSATQALQASDISPCQAGQAWASDGIHFQVLWPLSANQQGNNNDSCVLKVQNGNQSILLVGDIEKATEQALVKYYGSQLQAQLLIAPHHGSNTSSSEVFLQAVKPQWVIISSGFKNKYRLPSKKVLRRYAEHSIKVLNTAQDGTITFLVNSSNIQLQSRFRSDKKHFWQFS